MVFESLIDLMSFIALYPEEWRNRNYLSLSRVSGKALMGFLSERMDMETVYICTDSDKVGTNAVNRLLACIPEQMEVVRLIPCEKDWNEVLKRKDKLPQGRYCYKTIVLREKTEQKAVPVIRMSEIQQTEAEKYPLRRSTEKRPNVVFRSAPSDWPEIPWEIKSQASDGGKTDGSGSRNNL